MRVQQEAIKVCGILAPTLIIYFWYESGLSEQVDDGRISDYAGQYILVYIMSSCVGNLFIVFGSEKVGFSEQRGDGRFSGTFQAMLVHSEVSYGSSIPVPRTTVVLEYRDGWGSGF